MSSGRLAGTNAVRDASWSSSRCLVSFENGCITQNLPGVMAIERSPDSTFVAVAIDNGAIRFYEYPTTTVAVIFIINTFPHSLRKRAVSAVFLMIFYRIEAFRNSDGVNA